VENTNHTQQQHPHAESFRSGGWWKTPTTCNNDFRLPSSVFRPPSSDLKTNVCFSIRHLSRFLIGFSLGMPVFHRNNCLNHGLKDYTEWLEKWL